MAATPRYSTRQDLPYLIEVGQAVTLACPVYRDGALVASTAGTISIYDADGTAVVSAAAVTPGSTAEYTVSSLTTSGLDPSANWRVEWLLTLTGGDVVTPRSTAHLVRRRLYPTISDADIARRVPALATSFAGRPTIATTYQGLIDEADTEIQRRLILGGRRPWLVVDAWALREVYLTLTIALIYDALTATAGQGDPYTERAAHWRSMFEAEWARTSVQLDVDEDGQVDEPDTRASAKPSGVWLC